MQLKGWLSVFFTGNLVTQDAGLVSQFPGQSYVHPAYMSIRGELPVETALDDTRQVPEVELPHDRSETEVEMLLDQAGNPVIRDASCTEGLDLNTDRTGETEGVAELDFAFFREACGNDVLCRIPCRICTDTVDAHRVFAAQGCSALARIFSIRIDGVLPAGKP